MWVCFKRFLPVLGTFCQLKGSRVSSVQNNSHPDLFAASILSRIPLRLDLRFGICRITFNERFCFCLSFLFSSFPLCYMAPLTSPLAVFSLCISGCQFLLARSSEPDSIMMLWGSCPAVTLDCCR